MEPDKKNDRRNLKFLIIILSCLITIAFIAMIFSGCDKADMASWNISKAADNFQIPRRVIFYNGITDKYILVIEGYCSIYDDNQGQLEVTVKTGHKEYMKHFLRISDNVTYFSEQLEPSNVSENHYSITFKPEVVVPHFKRY